MLRNFLLVAWRNLIKNKGYGFINIFGLALGLAVAMTIGLWLQHEYSFDRFLANHERVYQVRRNFDNNGETLNFTTVSLKLTESLSKVPEVERAITTSWISTRGLMKGKKKLNFSGLSAENGFFQVFAYPFKKGSAAQALQEPYSIAISERVAKAFFGDANPIDQTIRYENQHDLKVTSVFENVPSNSTLQFDFVVPLSYFDATQPGYMKDMRMRYSQNAWQSFVQLKAGTSLQQVAPKIQHITRTEQGNNAQKSTVILQPLKRWHLYNTYINGKDIAGNIDYIRMFGIIAVLVLLIACINFINLSTARSEKRAREVGVRKAIGSLRNELIMQFLMESVLLTVLAAALAIVLLQSGLPYFNQLTGRTISIPWSQAWFWCAIVVLIAFTALAAGSRPAIYLSSFQPVKVLKGQTRSTQGSSLPRKILVVTQFACSVALIIATVTVYQQIEHVQNRPSGFDKNQLMTTWMQGELSANYTALKNELLQKGVVASMTNASSPATNIYWHSDIDQWPGKMPGETIEMATVVINDDYFQTMGMDFKEGHCLANNNDTTRVVFNESAIETMRITEPVGKTVVWDGKNYQIAGVVKNALIESPFQAAEPMMFLTEPSTQGAIIYRLSNKMPAAKAMAELTSVFNRYNPSFVYTYDFADESYARKFSMELMTGRLSGIFTILAVLISCLGLFGLSAYTAEQRSKEISIRKVLGASVTQVWTLLSKDYITLVLIGIVIACPLAAWFLQNWLNGYDYRIPLQWQAFAGAGVAALIVTIFTVSFQSIKAALTKPVSNLKDE